MLSTDTTDPMITVVMIVMGAVVLVPTVVLVLAVIWARRSGSDEDEHL